MTQEQVFENIQNDLNNNNVMLYMKGTPALPMCGFSGVVVKILNTLNVEFASKNILDDSDLREGIKTFSNWPTLPQLYIKGEFIGGCDIVKELYQSGELTCVLEQKGIPFSN
jgi:monothiol glutaredoxin